MKFSNLAERLQWLRSVSGVSRRAASLACGLSPGMIALIESQERSHLRLETLTALAKTFGVSLDWLLTGSGVEPCEDAVRTAVSRAQSQSEAGPREAA